MATIKDIARLLVDKHKMTLGASEEFVQKIVEVINEGLLQDRIVKIKGFGTFKLQEVKERSSVNINTGEKVVIAAHDKITFTPDSVMRDMVNKPFAHFETVLVGDNNNVNDNGNDNGNVNTLASVEAEETPEEAVPETIGTIDTIEAPEAPETPETPVETPEAPETPVETPEVTETPDVEVEEEDEDDNDDDEVRKCPCGYWFATLAGVVIAAIFFALGYFAAKNAWFEPKEPLKVEIVKEKKDSTQTQTQTAEAVKDTVKAEAKAEPATEQKTEPKAEAASDDASETYNKDPRVKYGAYTIVGTETEVTVRKGQTLKGISKAYLGPDMECYVEAYNNKKEVKEGDKIRIPKLKVKKRK
ncbi:MAG: HU family DNA-binding protein [Prevotella sp.]|nr:HU family DNA-binding protein [Prevotella sp.]